MRRAEQDVRASHAPIAGAGRVRSRPDCARPPPPPRCARASAWCREDVRAFHWRDRAGREADLLLERRDGSLTAFEHKLSTGAAREDFRHLAHLRDQLGDRFAAGALIYTGEHTLPFGDRLRAVPVGALWA